MKIKISCLFVFALFMFIFGTNLSGSETRKGAQTQPMPTVIRDINGEEVVVWPEKLPDKIAENWESVVSIFVSIESRDKNKKIPAELNHQSFGSGRLIQQNGQFYIQTVAHLFVVNLKRLIEYTKYTDEIFTIKAWVIDRSSGSEITGLPLELIAYEGFPYDFAIFKVIIPKMTISSYDRESADGKRGNDASSRFRSTEEGAVDWYNLRLKVPDTASKLASARPLKIAEPISGETIHILGYIYMGIYGMFPYHSVNFFSKTVKNTEIEVDGKKATLKKAYILRGHVIHGLSGSCALNERGELIGIFREATEDGSVPIVASAEDFVDFLKRHKLEFLIDKTSR